MTRQNLNRIRERLANKTETGPLSPGLSVNPRGIALQVVSDSESLALLLFRRNEAEPFFRAPLDPAAREGLVWYAEIPFEDFESLITLKDLEQAEYCFETESGLMADPFGRAFSGRDSFGKAAQFGNPLRSPLLLPDFDWEDDIRPDTPWPDTVIYRLNVRSFTMGAGSRVIQKGTFAGIQEKIPYLKELGVTAVELMPCQEFEELMPLRRQSGITPAAASAPGSGAASATAMATGPSGEGAASALPPSGSAPAQNSSAARPALKNQMPQAPTDFRINLWGYTRAFHFAPKASYCKKKLRSPSVEFRSLVKAMHQAGIQVFVEFYFDGSEDSAYISQVLRNWVHFYHIDGIRLTGFADSAALSRDPYLAGTRLIAGSWGDSSSLNRDRLAVSSDSFQNDMRRLLKGDEGMLGALMRCSQDLPRSGGSIHFMANTNGLTLMDAVSYDRKHNEENGEDNRDGAETDFSWNCGEEGPTKKKKVRLLRAQQLKNAVLLLLLSQGTPLIQAGDEFGNSQGGNNNAWCLDSPAGWVDWSQQRREAELFRFVQDAISFRKAHPVFRRRTPYTLLDPKATGTPDLSWHGERPWRPEFEPFRRQLGILYNGKYAEAGTAAAQSPKSPQSPKSAETPEAAAVYVLYNFHWEPHEFHLPNAPAKNSWFLKVSTSTEIPGGGNFLADGKEQLLSDQRVFTMPARCVVVLLAKKTPAPVYAASGSTPSSRSRKKGE